MTGKLRDVFPISQGKNSAMGALSFPVAKLAISPPKQGTGKLSSSFMLLAPKEGTCVSAT